MTTSFPEISREKLQQRIMELRSKLIRPLTKETAFYHYLPMFGVKSYVELSLNVINPSLSEQIYRKYNSWTRTRSLIILFFIFRLGLSEDQTTTNTIAAATCLGEIIIYF